MLPADMQGKSAPTHLGQTHTLQEDQGVGKLILPSLLVPSEFSTHDLDDPREGVQSGLNVQERQSGTTSDKVGRVNGVLGSACVSRLGLDIRVEVGQSDTVHGPALTGGGGHRSDGPGSVTISHRQVLGDLGVETELLDQLDEHGRGPGVGSDQFDVLSETRSLGLQAVLLDGVVDGLLGHGSTAWRGSRD
jgi:hypothetical protein